jgi:hypothetical protein
MPFFAATEFAPVRPDAWKRTLSQNIGGCNKVTALVANKVTASVATRSKSARGKSPESVGDAISQVLSGASACATSTGWLQLQVLCCAVGPSRSTSGSSVSTFSFPLSGRLSPAAT